MPILNVVQRYNLKLYQFYRNQFHRFHTEWAPPHTAGGVTVEILTHFSGGILFR